MEPPTLTLTPLLSSNHHPLPPDDFSTRNADDFFVDGLLDFSTNDVDAAFLQDDHNSQLLHDTKPSSLSPIKTTLPETELSLPVDDVAELEWLSQFVDDSFSGGYVLTFPAGNLPERKPESETVTLVAVNPHFNKTLVHKKARSKRSRTGGRVWSLRSSAPVTDSSASSSSSSSSCTSKPPPAVEEGLGNPPPVKRQKGRSAAAEPAPMARRCSHCFVQKTPQWRAGPLGAKTLCNACGVRFKSGRLLPEYRPACSPTFSSEVHSNSHRKVLEMRRKKEEDGDGPSLPVHSS